MTMKHSRAQTTNNTLRKFKLIIKNTLKLNHNKNQQYVLEEFRKLGFDGATTYNMNWFYDCLKNQKPKRRAAIMRLGRAALKQNDTVQIYGIFTEWSIAFKSEHQIDLRTVKFSERDYIAGLKNKIGDLKLQILAIEDIIRRVENKDDCGN